MVRVSGRGGLWQGPGGGCGRGHILVLERLTVVMGKHQERELLQSEGDLIVRPAVFSCSVGYVHQGPERRRKRSRRTRRRWTRKHMWR